MELQREITIDAPAETVWQAVGERFMQVAEWAAPINSSCPLGPRELEVGATRVCNIAPFGPVRAGVVKERVTKFDRVGMTLEYEALEGLPKFVLHATNRWSIAPVDHGRSRLRIHATLRLRGMVALLGWVIRWQFESGGAKVAEELKHFVENGRPHPRKLAAAAARDSVPHQGNAVLPGESYSDGDE